MSSTHSLWSRALCFLDTLEIIWLQQVRRDIAEYRRQRILGMSRIRSVEKYAAFEVQERLQRDGATDGQTSSGYSSWRSRRRKDAHETGMSRIATEDLHRVKANFMRGHGNTASSDNNVTSYVSNKSGRRVVSFHDELNKGVTFLLSARSKAPTEISYGTAPSSSSSASPLETECSESVFRDSSNSTPRRHSEAHPGSTVSVEPWFDPLPCESRTPISKRRRSYFFSPPTPRFSTTVQESSHEDLTDKNLVSLFAPSAPTLGSLFEVHRRRRRVTPHTHTHSLAVGPTHVSRPPNVRLIVDFLNFADRYAIDSSTQEEPPPSRLVSRISMAPSQFTTSTTKTTPTGSNRSGAGMFKMGLRRSVFHRKKRSGFEGLSRFSRSSRGTHFRHRLTVFGDKKANPFPLFKSPSNKRTQSAEVTRTVLHRSESSNRFLGDGGVGDTHIRHTPSAETSFNVAMSEDSMDHTFATDLDMTSDDNDDHTRSQQTASSQISHVIFCTRRECGQMVTQTSFSVYLYVILETMDANASPCYWLGQLVGEPFDAI
eukprot:Blabericola_migrator_1__5177@NODE_266_length_10604_cov_114_195881_g222_i0_p2_GENE_NODE_266_length_10604_cov_114_195881_g222_i0NODE_266_length_10604_cov_114_195881_g222_i0_p2_ORF_typecomplete_len543_score86_48GOLD_2/PF13897_6/0_16_NODE_266_length_10604_cov_114_195881_g222_i048126440